MVGIAVCGVIHLTVLIGLAIAAFFKYLWTLLCESIIKFIMDVISIINTNLLNAFSIPVISDFIFLGIRLGEILYAATFIILLMDIAEEASSMKSDQFKAIEWTTIFANLVKAFIFVEAAPRLAIMSMQTGARLVKEFDPSSYLNFINSTAPHLGLIGLLIMLVGVVGFALITMMRFAAMLIQAFSAFLYIPDIVRGHTTSMGDWIRQAVCICLTFFLQQVLFFMGIVCFYSSDVIPACMLWLGMFYTPVFLGKYGMSSGVTGVLSSGARIATSTINLIGGK